jgi:hypothetical protein
MGILIVLMLGFLAGVLAHRISQRFWIASLGAAGASTLLWCLGVYALLIMNADSQLEGPLLVPVLLIAAANLTGAVLAGLAIRGWRGPVYASGCCAHCGYDLTGNTSGICPECGTAIAPPESPEPP